MLTLTNIKTSRINNRINLVFSDTSYLPLFVDDLFKLKLVKGQSVTPKKLALLKEKSSYYLGREYALRQIAISPKSKKILSKKLKNFFHKRKLDCSQSKIIDNILSDLESRNLLNANDFISYFINKNKHRSQKEIIFRLHQQGIDIDFWELKKIIPDNDLTLIRKILDKKKITPKDLKDFNYRQKIMASLFRRGFNLEDIRKSIDDHLNLK